MGVRVLALLEARPQHGANPADVVAARLGAGSPAAGFEVVVVAEAPAAASPRTVAASRGSGRSVVARAKKALRPVTKRVKPLLEPAVWSGRLAARSVMAGTVARHALAAYQDTLEWAADPARSIPVAWRWHARQLEWTLSMRSGSLRRRALADAVGQAAVLHSDQAFDAVLVSADSPQVAGTALLLARVLDLPLVVDTSGDWADPESHVLPSPTHLLADVVLAHASATWPGTAQADVLDDVLRSAIGARDRTTPRPPQPVVSVLIEADADHGALATTLDALRSSSVPHWEALVITEKTHHEQHDAVVSLVMELDDPRITVHAVEHELFEQYPAWLQHLPRAYHLVRLRPGDRVAPDFVARVARTVLGTGTADGWVWSTHRLRAGGAAKRVVSGVTPQPLKLLDLAKWWYPTGVDTVYTWRAFRLFGGFAHVPDRIRGSLIEQVVLCESAALSGVLFDTEVPLAYRRMAALSRAIGPEAADQTIVPATPPALDEFVGDVSGESGSRYAGMTVLFVRHALVTYDARMLKEGGSLLAQGARVVVAGVAPEPPASLVEAGFEVFSVAEKDEMPRVVEFMRELDPDVVHAYDVLSYELLEPLLTGGRAHLVYECRDLLVAPGYLVESDRIEKLAREREIVARADAVIAVSEPSAQWIEQEHGIEGVVPILHGSTLVLGADRAPGDPVRLLFQGALRPNRGLFTLLSAMPHFRGRAMLGFQSFGTMNDALRAYIDRLGITDMVEFLPVCGPLEVVRYAALFDVGIISYAGSTENLLRTTPNKLLDYVSAGLAIVASDLPGLRGLVDESNGVFFEPGSARDLADAIERLIRDRDALAAAKHVSRVRALETRWGLEQEKLFSVYDRFAVPTGHADDTTRSTDDRTVEGE